MFDQFISVKEQFTHALHTLPDFATIPVDGKITRINLSEKRNKDIAALNNYWEFVVENSQNRVIGLVGMVDVGKSALGNFLLHGGESAFFKESPIRETSQASKANLDSQTIVVDLPGLGSVLKDDDDAVVKAFIRRANLLLVVISVDTSIPRHLYEFFQSDLIKNHNAQRIIIVLNKVDIWDGIPESHRKEELAGYTEFLMKGDSRLGFSGIGELFDYDIPVIPFSVRHIRSGKGKTHEALLRNAIEEALAASSDGHVIRAFSELTAYIGGYEFLIRGFFEIEGILGKIKKDMEWIHEKINHAFQTEADRLLNLIHELDQACWNEMLYLPKPEGWEIDEGWIGKAARELFGTQGLENKKDKLQNVRRQYESKIKGIFDNFASNLQQTINTILRGAFPDCQAITLPDVSEIHSALEGIIYVNWDMQDDMYFRNKYISKDTISKKTQERFETVIEKVEPWWQKFGNNIAERLEPVLEARCGEQIIESYCQLETFVKAMYEMGQLLETLSEEEN